MNRDQNAINTLEIMLMTRNMDKVPLLGKVETNT